MNKKHFVLIEDVKVDKKELDKVRQEKERKLKNHAKKRDSLNEKKLQHKVNLKHTYGRAIIVINVESKNSHTFSTGEKIYIGRQFNNLNRRETEPVNAYVISADGIPAGVEILIHPNAIIDSNKIFSFQEDNTDVKYYSIPEEQCYLWKNDNDEWLPLKNYATGLRVFKPYEGPLLGISPELIPNVLYITSGEFKGQVVRTLKASDYEIIFMGSNGYEERIIRCRHFENEINEREEIVAADYFLSKKVKKGDFFVGINALDAKSIIFTI